ncbi:hypothetical protein [Polyangium mundeleinium]|uniref:Proteinase inhibitor I42 chagasin domain-containing protein n=1 Tax=Polyangium mundeleinium TaxID=2995306 RepID=A0ABT5F5F8_9BACT|nr:hypothetical protein [Polyangium mundeleinium]MDC0749327.1 hypothetical protein [Polyangium mundeleinium]
MPCRAGRAPPPIRLFPWRHTSLFLVGAAGGEVELRSSSETEPGTESGIEPWFDAVGFLVFELPPIDPPQGYRWFHVMVGASADTFPGALGGGLEGPDWMTTELNQNGKVTTRFVTRTDAEGAFVMRHYAYTSGGLSGVFDVPVTVRIEGALTKP